MAAVLTRLGGDAATAVAELRVGARQHVLRVRLGSGGPDAATSGGALAARMDGFVAAALPVAMRTGEDLEVHGPVSSVLLEQLLMIQQLYAAWNADLHEVRVHAADALANPESPRSPASVALFSGGVDSFDSALRHTGDVDALVFVHGFDIGPERTAKLDRVAAALRRAAGELEKPLVEVITDLKVMSRQYLGWWWYHGAAIASVALLLAPMFGRVIIPSSLSYDDAHPCGSHPLVDGLWSTDVVDLVHDGFDANRLQKVARIADSEIAMRWLRVCNAGDESGYNCGCCEKCLRTMVALRAVGALERCATFPSRIDPGLVERLAGPLPRPLWKQNLSALPRDAASRRLAEAVRALLADRVP